MPQTNKKIWNCDLDPECKARKYGMEALTDAELLALLIRCGTKEKNALEVAKEILGDQEGFYGLMESNRSSLTAIDGIGQAKASLLLAVRTIVIRASQQKRGPRLVMNNAHRVAEFFMEQLRYLKKEQVILCLLDNKCRYMGQVVLAEGTCNSATISPREVYIEALMHRACGIILLHNHPSGDPTPSSEDRTVTTMCALAGENLGIPLMDHIVIGDLTYFSFKEQGLI